MYRDERHAHILCVTVLFCCSYVFCSMLLHMCGFIAWICIVFVEVLWGNLSCLWDHLGKTAFKADMLNINMF